MFSSSLILCYWETHWRVYLSLVLLFCSSNLKECFCLFSSWFQLYTLCQYIYIISISVIYNFFCFLQCCYKHSCTCLPMYKSKNFSELCGMNLVMVYFSNGVFIWNLIRLSRLISRVILSHLQCFSLYVYIHAHTCIYTHIYTCMCTFMHVYIYCCS